MAYINTYTFKYSSSANIKYTLEIWDQGTNATTWANKKGTLGKKNCQISWGSENAKMYAPLKPSTLTIDFLVTDVLAANYLKQLRDNRQERDVYVYLYNTGTTSVKIPGDSPIFSGYLLMDLAEDPDVSVPYAMKLKAIDGLASLKYYDFIPHDKDQAADHLYSYDDTWLPGNTNSYNSFYPFRQWISRILRYSGYSTTTTGCSTDAEFQTSVNWFNGNMANTTGDPLDWTRATGDQFYKKEGDTGDIKYKPLTCYDALQSICKTWGMRCFVYKNTFYFIGINTYTEDNTGTLASPTNINWHRYTITGSSASPATGSALDLEWGRYYNPVYLTQANKKIAGSQYGVLPAFKKVSVDFLNVSNINYFQGFPKIPQPYPVTTGSGYMLNEETIGTFDFDGTNARTFFQEIYLDFQNNSGGDIRYECRWHIKAKKVGTGTWYQYGYPNWNGTNPFPGWFTMSGLSSTTSIFTRGHLIIPPGGSSFNAITDLINSSWYGSTFNQWVECPATVFTAGDWEFKYETVTEWFSGSQSIAYGHGRCDPIPWTGGTYNTDPDSNFITYTDSSITQGVGSSFFSPIANGIIGTELTNTQIVQAGLDTDFEEVTNVLWGDLPYGGAGRIEIYNGTGWQNSGFQGYWGVDSLTGQNSLAETLCEEIFKRQAQNVRKFSTKINLDALNYTSTDSSGTVPMYGTPFTRWFTPSHSGSATFAANWIMHSGSFDTGSDTWGLVLYEFETFNKSITTTTTGNNGDNSGGVGTNTGSGTVVPSQTAGGVGMTLANPARNNSRAIAKIMQNATRPISIITASQPLGGEGTLTVTSLTVQAIPNAILKSGDTVLVMCQYQPQATSTLDETNTIEYGNVEFVLSSDQSAGATTLSVVSKTIYQTLTKGDVVTISQPDLMAQYQNKTKGTVAGFGIDADGISKGGIEITDWLNSDTMSGAAVTNVPTALSVKNYVDAQVSATDSLQEVTTVGNTTTNSITIGNATSPSKALDVYGNADTGVAKFRHTTNGAYGSILLGSINYIYGDNGQFYWKSGSTELMRLKSNGNLLINTTNDYGKKFWVTGNAQIYGDLKSETFNVTNYATIPSILLQNSVTVLNKAQTSYISLLTRNTSGTEVAYDLTNVGAATFSGLVSGITPTVDANLTTKGYVDTQVASIPKGLSYQGTWNASTNTPTIVSSVGTAGYYWIVSVEGTTTIDGVSDWKVGDWIIFSDGGVYQKIDQSEGDTLQTVTTRGSTTTTGATFGGDVTVTKSSAAIQVNESGGSTVKIAAVGSTGYIGTYSSHPFSILQNSGTAISIDTSRNTTFTGTITSGQIYTDYGLRLTNGNTNFLLYNNTGDDLLYMRDITNGAMITTWKVNSFDVNKNLIVTGSLTGTTATFSGDVSIAVNKKLYFGGGSHTYIGEDIDDRLRFFTGGAEFMRFTEDTTNSIILFEAITGTTATFSGDITTTGSQITVNPASGDAILQLQHSSQTLRIDQNSIRTTTNSHLSLMTNHTAALYIDTSQQIGIGNTSPQALLHITKSNATATFEIQGGLTSITEVDQVFGEINFGANDASVTGGMAGSIKSIAEYNNGAHVGLAFYTGRQSRTPYLQRAMQIRSTGAISFGSLADAHGNTGQILKSNGDSSPTWVDASTVIGGPYLPLTGGTLTGSLTGTTATFTTAVNTTSAFNFTANTAYIKVGTSWNTGVLNFLNGATTYLQFDVPNNRIKNNLGKYLTSSGGVAQFGSLDDYDVAFVSNNVEKMRLNSTGLGINTSTPQTYLDVNLGGNTNQYASIGGTISSGEYTGIHFGYLETGNSLYRKSMIVFERTDLTESNAQGKIHILNGPQSGSASATIADAKLTIGESGNVGIGNTNPAAFGKFVVEGTGNLISLNSTSGVSKLGFFENGTGRMYLQSLSGSNGLAFIDGNNSTELMRLDSTGLGIGTTSPAAVLHLYGGNTNLLIQSSHGRQTLITQGGGHLHVDAQHGNGVAINYGNTTNAGLLALYNNTTANITLNGSNGSATFSGDVTLANNQSYKGTHLNGSSVYGLLTLTSGNVIKMGGYDYTSAAVEIGCGDHAKFLIGSTEKMRLTNDGKLGVGESSPAGLIHAKQTTNDARIIVEVDSNGSSAAGAYFEAKSEFNNYHGVGFFSGTTPTEKWFLGSYGSGSFSIISGTRSAGTKILNVTTDNRVGIGTDAPQSLLHISASSAPVFRMSRTGTGQVWRQEIDSSGRFQLKEAASEGGTSYTRFQIDDTGEVDIYNTLTINNGSGNVELASSSSGDLTVTSGDDIRLDAGGNDIVLRSSGTEFARLTRNSGLQITSSETNANINLIPNGSGQVIVPTTPTATNSAASKSYVDAQIGANNDLSEVLANGNTSGANDIAMALGQKVYFNNANENIYSNVNGDLQINARTELRIKANSNNTSGNSLEFWNGDAEKMRLTSGGELCVGYTSNQGLTAKFLVNGNAYFSGNILPAGGILIEDGSSSAPSLRFNNDTDTGLYRAAADTVGIAGALSGTTATFSGNATFGNGGNGKTNFGSSSHYIGNIGANLYSVTSGQSIFYSSTTERMRILANGNVGIAITNPTGILHAYATTGIISESPANAGITIRRNDNVQYSALLKYHSGNSEKWVAGLSDAGDFTGSTGNDYFIGQTKNTPVFLINTSNNVLIGTTTDSGNAKLQVDGNAEVSGNTALGTTVSAVYRLDVNGKARVQSVLELDDVLTLNAIATPSDPANNKSSIWMATDGAIKCKINVNGTVVVRTLASFE